MTPTPDVLVIGGGVIGCAVAHALAGEGRRVVLVDRGALGGEASSASAGVLAVASSTDPDGPRLALRRASRARVAALASELHETTGIDVGYEVRGVLELCLDEAEEAAAVHRLVERRAQGFRVDHLDATALRVEEPCANPDARVALLFPDDARIDGARLVEALAAAARGRGAVLCPGHEVVVIERAGGRVARVRVGGDWLTPGEVVLAAGAWAGALVPGVRVVPARGQMLALRPAAPLSRRILSHGDGYLVPAGGGEWLVGATIEDAGFVKAVTPTGLSTLRERLATLAPSALAAPVVRTWSGLRPFAPDGGPILGRHPEAPNLILACGHHRNGILLAPITAAVVVALVDGTPPPLDVAPFLPPAGSGA